MHLPPRIIELSIFRASGQTACTRQQPKFYLGKGERLGANDVAVPELTVDGYHAEIAWDGTDYVIRALDSTDLLRVGGIPLTPGITRTLLPECILQMGATRIVARQPSLSPIKRYLSRDELDIARAEIERERHDRTRWGYARVIPVEAPPDVVRRNQTFFSTIELKPRTPPKPYRLGKSRICEIHVVGDGVADEHVALAVESDVIRVTNTHTSLVHLGNRTLEPGAQTVWHGSDMLKIGPVVFGLYDPIEHALRMVGPAPAERGNDGRLLPSAPFEPEPPCRKPLASLASLLSGTVTIELPESEALVLFDWLLRFNNNAAHDNTKDLAGRRLLQELEGTLEPILLPKLIDPMYERLLEEARAKLRDPDTKFELAAHLGESNDEPSTGGN
ncbi:hypothetical protein LVJ94_27785 [Pendulispora rubella]|uniref:FHA domain-containing protein n=1 Tax=Pendulispora rubella TaxID=2741070 RepID=A0ABZ2KPZ7_9BACT